MFFLANEEESMQYDHSTLFLDMKRCVAALPEPAIIQLKKRFSSDPFLILMATLLSLRARDTATLPVATALYSYFPTPYDLAGVSESTLYEILRPIGFFRVKSRVLLTVSRELITRHQGNVPCDEKALLDLPGVGRKTANLVRAEAFGIPALCVDTHVHRLANHWGWVITKTPEETEYALMRLFPQEYWIDINRVLVTWGQYVCKPRARVCRCKEFLVEGIKK